MGTRNFRTLRWNIFAKTKKFAKPFSPVQTGPQSNLLSKKWSIISWHCRFKAVIPGCKAALVGQLMRSRSHAAAAASPGGPAPRTLVGTGCWCRGGGLPPPRTPTVGWNDFLKKKLDTCHVVPYSKIAFLSVALSSLISLKQKIFFWRYLLIFAKHVHLQSTVKGLCDFLKFNWSAAMFQISKISKKWLITPP